MSVICFTSLKGGVGKTSLSINIAHAYAARGCQVLVIDFDPAGHASRLLKKQKYAHQSSDTTSPLARLFLATDLAHEGTPRQGIIDTAAQAGVSLLLSVRENVDLISSGVELRHFLWGKGGRLFKTLFPRLISELHDSYDYIVIDTPPDYNMLTRNAIGVADLVVVPVDASEMSIYCMEEIINSASHIKGPSWAIARTMVSRSASRVQQLSTTRLGRNLDITAVHGAEAELEEEVEPSYDISDTENFLSAVKARENKNREVFGEEQVAAEDSPIYLLDSVVYRTELQNKLTFEGKTAFDNKHSAKLAEQYLAIAREFEQILSMSNEDREASDAPPEYFPSSLGAL